MIIKEWFSDVSKLLFPNLCLLCNQDIISNEKHICSACLYSLPYINFHEREEHALHFLLKGRFNFEKAISCLYFNSDSKVQKMLHEIKYQGNYFLAEYWGELMAHKYLNQLKQHDVIIPVPLHKHRVAERGYNQSYHLAQGLSTVLDIPVMQHVVKRIKDTDTQTHKSKAERLENMKDAFEWTQIENQRILLIDDVITTGSTLESLVLALPSEWKNKITILSLAVAVDS